MIKGVNKEALMYIVGQIRRREVDSVEEFQRTASILGAYDHFSDYHTEPLAHQFIRHNHTTSQNNLSTEQILDDIINGTDLTSLMDVEKESFGNRQRYEWETRDLNHGDVLHQLRELGNSMYKQIDTPFNLTEEYEQMRGIAGRWYDISQELFRFWESIVRIDPEDIVASTPLELAQEIFEYVKNDDNRINILQGVRAIMYIDQENPQQEVDNVVRDFASYFVGNIPTDTKRAIKLRKTLTGATAYLGPPAQEAVV